jgi:ADP-dependent phosphofructokinase/glucokinase
VDSLGANEQEISALYDVFTQGHMHPDSYASHPEIGGLIKKIEKIMDDTSLTRVHLHALAFQTICQRPNSGWPDPTHSLLEALLTATRQACQNVRTSFSIIKRYLSFRCLFVCLSNNGLFPFLSIQENVPAGDVELLYPEQFQLETVHRSSPIKFNPDKPITCIDYTSHPASQGSRGMHCCVAPVLVCRHPKRTVGLGDHISASGLTAYL